jgi:signal transduction histidine kinase
MTGAPTRTKSHFYGELAFVAVVLAVFYDQLRPGHPPYASWQIATVVTLGLLYVAIGAIGVSRLEQASPLQRAAYFVTECGLVTAMILIWPQKGFFAIAAMPILSIAVMDLPWRWSALATIELWGAACGAVAAAYGWRTALHSFPSYATPFIFTIVFSIVTRKALAAKQEAEQLSGQLAAANEQLRLHAAQAGEMATTRERNRLAREIHDGIGHYLTTINVQLEAAQAVFAAQPEQARGAIEKASRLSRDALDEVRRSVGALRADAPRASLAENLRALAENVGVPVVLHWLGSPRPLVPAVELALYRAAQEALTNVARHAAATRAELTLDFSRADRVQLRVNDNGRGASGGGHVNGFGLTGMRERVQLLGGSASCGNGPQGGFAVTVELPA